MSSTPRPTFGARLRQARQRRKLSQASLGRRLGVPQGNVSRWETDQCEPRLGFALKIARTLGVSLDDLLRGVPA